MPPPPLIAGRVIFAVVDGAKRDGELVANFQRQPSRLSIPNMMRMRRCTPADHAWLLGDEA